MSDQPLLDGTYEKLVGDFLTWQRRAKVAAAIAVIAGLVLVALGAFAFLRAEDTRTIVKSPEGVPCANPTSARCLTEAVGVSRAIGYVEACRIVVAARLEAPSCAILRTGAPSNRPDRANGDVDGGVSPTSDSERASGGGSEQASPTPEQSGPSEDGSSDGPAPAPGDGGASADPEPSPSPEPGPGPAPDHGGLAGDVDDAVDEVTDTACDTAGELGVNPPGVCR